MVDGREVACHYAELDDLEEPMADLWLIDAFADAPFSGNPAAVCMLPGHRPDDWHHALAAEMNQAETAFLSRQDGDWGLRWFTPRVEVDLCGHATLASAHFLWESGRLLAPQRPGFIPEVAC